MEIDKNHPEVKRLQSQIGTLEETLKKRLQALRNGLETDFIIAKNKWHDQENTPLTEEDKNNVYGYLNSMSNFKNGIQLE